MATQEHDGKPEGRPLEQDTSWKLRIAQWKEEGRNGTDGQHVTKLLAET